MANPYLYPMGYNPYQQAANLLPTATPQIQNGGFVRVKSEKDVLDYPLAPGYTMTFIDEGATHCYTKTMGFNQFEKAKIDKYRLVKESVDETPVANALTNDSSNLVRFALKADLEAFSGKIEGFEKELAEMKKMMEKETPYD